MPEPSRTSNTGRPPVPIETARERRAEPPSRGTADPHRSLQARSLRRRAGAGWRRDDRLVLLACLLLVALELAVLYALRAVVLSGMRL